MSTSSFQILFSSQIQSPPSKSKVKPLFFSLLITDKNKTQTFLQIVYNQNCSPICSILWNQEVNSQAKKKERVYTIRGGLQLLRKCTIKAKVITLSNDNKRTTSNEPIIAQRKDNKQALSTENPASKPRLFLPQTLIGFKRGEKPGKLKQRKVNRENERAVISLGRVLCTNLQISVHNSSFMEIRESLYNTTYIKTSRTIVKRSPRKGNYHN